MSRQAVGDLDPARVAVILAGSDEYPEAPDLSNPRFRAVHDGVLKYFSDDRGIGIPPERILDLFASELNATAQAVKLHEFCQRLGATSDSRGWTLFVHYVGHGDTFASPSSEYYLTVRGTRRGLEKDTSLSFSTVARTIGAVPGTRVFIVDACFAASATKFLQAGPDARQRAVTKLMEGAFEGPNTILFAAASKDSFAEAPEALIFTMFGQALLEALGVEPAGLEALPVLSATELYRRVCERVVAVHGPLNAVKPELHFPKQASPDIGEVRLFPVFVSEPVQADALGRTAVLEQRMARLEEGVFRLSRHARWAGVLGCILVLVGIGSAVWTKVASRPVTIALESDYGLRTHYVGALKGALLNGVPGAELVDITHEVTAFDIVESAWTLVLAARRFPADTVFVVVTNPGGLTAAPPTVVVTNNGQRFVGFDNGTFDFVVESLGFREGYRISSPAVSPADLRDGGLDVLAPAAIKVAGGYALDRIGPALGKYEPKLKRISHSTDVASQSFSGTVMGFDDYGNANSNLTSEGLAALALQQGDNLELTFVSTSGGQRAVQMSYQYTYEKVGLHEPVAIFNDGLLQFAVREGSFQSVYGVDRYSYFTGRIRPKVGAGGTLGGVLGAGAAPTVPADPEVPAATSSTTNTVP